MDYDRSQFYLTQALVPDQRAALELRTVSPPGNNDVLRPGPIAGVAIGSVVFLALLGVSFWWCLRRRRRSAGTGAREAGKSATDLSKEDQDQDQRAFKPELDATNTAVGRGMERQELETPTDLAKLPKSSSVGAVELGDAQVHEAEAPLTRAAGWKPGVSELDDAAVHELGGSHAYRELPARQDARQYQAELP